MPSCGGLLIVEDFVPFSHTRALVTCGPDLRHLCVVGEVNWRIDGEEIVLSNMEVLVRGDYVRLGHYHQDALIYSDGWLGKHQPHMAGKHYYCSNDAPEARIYRDGKLFIDHWNGVAEVCNPWVHDEHIYFEARDEGVKAPLGWDVWRCDLSGENREKICHGANPCVFRGLLYYGVWNGRSFDIATRPN